MMNATNPTTYTVIAHYDQGHADVLLTIRAASAEEALTQAAADFPAGYTGIEVKESFL